MEETEDTSDICLICGKPTQDSPYYAGDNHICSQECLYEWDYDHPNLDAKDEEQ